jgi:hypothetical protein
MPIASGGQAALFATLPERLDRLGVRYQRRSLDLKTSRKNLLPLDYHVQGITRIDHPSGLSTLACSAADEPTGTLWIASFQREHFTTKDGRAHTRLAQHGTTVATLPTTTPHPGGMQAAGTWLSVANEGRGLVPSVDIYDLANPSAPRHHDRLALQGQRGAGWVAMAQRSEDEFVLFVGGPGYAREDSWLYGYRPSRKSFSLLGTFDGKPDTSPWEPQNGGSLFVDAKGLLYLITQGNKGTSGSDAYRERVRCFELTVTANKEVVLRQQPAVAPKTYRIDADPHPEWLGELFFRTPNLRWGSGVFVDEHGELVMYVTARAPLYTDDGFCHLEVVEIRAQGT